MDTRSSEAVRVRPCRHWRPCRNCRHVEMPVHTERFATTKTKVSNLFFISTIITIKLQILENRRTFFYFLSVPVIQISKLICVSCEIINWSSTNMIDVGNFLVSQWICRVSVTQMLEAREWWRKIALRYRRWCKQEQNQNDLVNRYDGAIRGAGCDAADKDSQIAFGFDHSRLFLYFES